MELVRFFCEVKIHDHAHYFVDSLWEHCDVLHSWETMSQLLLDDKSSFTLKDDEVKALVEIMTCAVRRAAGATPPSGRSKGKVCHTDAHECRYHKLYLSSRWLLTRRRKPWRLVRKR